MQRFTKPQVASIFSPHLDRCDCRVSCCRGLSCGSFYFGRRHLWYLIGTILVIVNFFFLFARCVMCDLTGDHQMNSDANLAYYAFAAALFNVGWAAVQVSHMALVPGTTNKAAHARFRCGTPAAR